MAKRRSRSFVSFDVEGVAARISVSLPLPMGMGLKIEDVHRFLVTVTDATSKGKAVVHFQAFDKQGVLLAERKMKE